MKISSCTTALEKALQPELASPPTLEQDIGLATLLHTLTLQLKETLHTLEEHSDQIAEDIFHFGFLWEYIAKLYPHTSDICHEIIQRRHELYAQKSSLKDYIENHSDIEFSQTAQAILQSGQLEPALEGAGAAYFLIDTLGNPRYVIKPIDEDIFCLNNRKQFGSPLADPLIRVRNFIPLYRSAQTDVLAYRVACHLGIESVTPKTEIMIIDSDAFFDITQRLSEQDSHKYLSCLEVSDKEKVCSVQEYVHGSVMMQQLIYSWLREGLSEEEISSKLCPEDFEKANLLIWTSFDTDAHLGNFVLYPKEKGLYGIKKVDNGLSFPEDNAELRNFLTFFSQAKTPLSSDLKEKIKTIPKEAILSDMHLLSLSEQAKQAFVRRTDTIQSLAEKEGMTIYEMNLRLMLLGKEEGDVDALKEMSLEELESLVGLQTSTTKETSAK